MEATEHDTGVAARPTIPVLTVSLSAKTGVRVAIGIFVAYFISQLAGSLSETLTRVALGLVFAFALDPVVVRMQQRFRCSRGSAVAIVSVIALAVFAVLVAVVGPSAVEQAESSSRVLPTTVDKLSELPVVGNLLDRVDAQERIRSWASNLPERISDRSIADLIQSVVGGLLAGLTVIVVGMSCLLDGDSLVRRLNQLVPPAHRERAQYAGRVFYRTIGAYFAGSLFVAILAATYVLIVGLALGVPLAPVAALWVLIVAFIPQIGGFLAASVFTILAFGKGPGTALACLILYWLYMMFENHVIQPVVVGTAVNLSAAATMLAVLIGGAALGVPGAILATPVVGTTKALYMELKYPDRTVQHNRHSIFATLRTRFWPGEHRSS